jgi:hypothetical protein
LSDVEQSNGRSPQVRPLTKLAEILAASDDRREAMLWGFWHPSQARFAY